MSCISEEISPACMETTPCYPVYQQITALSLSRNFKLLMEAKGNDGLVARCF